MKPNREKILGQYFSGVAIPRLLYDLLGKKDVAETVIDPMCGIGDMFSPFADKKIRLYGNEIDHQACLRATSLYPNAMIQCVNAFSSDAILGYHHEGYDVVMTNPPYVRYQIIGIGGQIIENKWMGADEIKANLKQYAAVTKTLNDKERRLIISEIDSISGLSDLSIPSWLLCMMLVKMGGELAMVVPTSWLSREYAKPVAKILKSLFRINYIVNDANMSWFRGKAQVKTSLVVASRERHVPEDCMLNYVDLFRNASSGYNLTGRILSHPIQEVFKKTSYDNSLYTVHQYYQRDFLNQISNHSGRKTTRLNEIDGIERYAHFESLINLGVYFGQGLRTGANTFFYVPANHVIAQTNKDCMAHVIQSQKDLGESYSSKDCNCHFRLLYLQDMVTSKDYSGLLHEASRKGLHQMNESLDKYIREAEVRPFKGKLIPGMSSVRTNVRKETESQPPRFWYMLPKLTKRHTGSLFIPRVNGDKVIARINENDYVIDANFITVWLDSSSPFDEYALLALLNSQWCRLLFEENGTVLGGGALKLDAVQMKKVFIPSVSEEVLPKLSELGMCLCQRMVSDSKEIIRQIDTEILKEAGVKSTGQALDQLSDFNEYYLNQRI